MSQTFIAGFVILAAQILKLLGVDIGSEALTTTVTTLVTIGSVIWMLVRRHQAGGVTAVGTLKN